MNIQLSKIAVAADQLHAEILEGIRTSFVVGITFKGGEPCCAGGWVLWMAGFRPDGFQYNGVYNNNIFKFFLGQEPPKWLMDKWHSIESANDDDALEGVRKMMYVASTLQDLSSAIKKWNK